MFRNILFISSLYPMDEVSNPLDRTLALHHFVKYWNRRLPEGRVLVICPVYVYLRELLTGRSRLSLKDLFRSRSFMLDDVIVIVYPVFKIPKVSYFFYPLYRFLNRYIKRTGFVPDVVVAHYDKSLVIGYEYAKMRKIPFVAGLHITPDIMAGNSVNFERRCGRIMEFASLIACRSEYIFNKIATWFPRYGKKSFVAFSGIDESIIQSSESSIRKMKEWKRAGEISFITVSSLISRKQIDIILRALASVHSENQKLASERGEKPLSWTYKIIGEGEEYSRLKLLSVELGIDDHVCFMGSLAHEEVLEELKKSHIFLLVSYLETVGLVYLEAMAAGNIVVGSLGEGIDGIIRNEENGFLVSSGNVESLVKVIKHILYEMDETQLETILKKTYETMTQYTEEKAALNYWNHLNELSQRVS